MSIKTFNYKFRVKNRRLILFILLIGSISFSNAQRNSLIPKPYLWLKADSVNHEQNYWVDQSGHNHHVYFNSSVDSGKINYQPSLRIETSNPYSIPYHPKKKDVICMFAVYKADTSQNGYSIWSVRLDSSNFIEMNSHYIRGLYGTNSYEGSVITRSKLFLQLATFTNRQFSSFTQYAEAFLVLQRVNGKYSFLTSLSLRSKQGIPSCINYGISKYH
jgi:hypothetical protein